MEAAATEVPVDACMPITGVTLYDNGYAVFQRDDKSGAGTCGSLLSHRAHAESLQFTGDAGKKVGNIPYEATRPTSV